MANLVSIPHVRRRCVVEFLSLRGIEFPPPMVTELARRTAGADATGAVPLRVSPAFLRVVIHPTGVILFRRKGGA